MTTAFASPGSMNVDWEERWNVDRLRTYRLGRARAALDASDVGAVLLFDFNNIRYVTSTHIGEWARDKMTRYALLSRGGDPHVWDFGSAARGQRKEGHAGAELHVIGRAEDGLGRVALDLQDGGGARDEAGAEDGMGEIGTRFRQ